MPSRPMDQKERITRSIEVDANGCWNWQLGTDRIGYGRVKVSMGSRGARRTIGVHRYAFELWRGAVPAGMVVMHRCDNRACCNPDHLLLGTQGDNIRDMHAKGRGPRGYTRDPAICADNARKRTAAIDAALAAREGR